MVPSAHQPEVHPGSNRVVAAGRLCSKAVVADRDVAPRAARLGVRILPRTEDRRVRTARGLAGDNRDDRRSPVAGDPLGTDRVARIVLLAQLYPQQLHAFASAGADPIADTARFLWSSADEKRLAFYQQAMTKVQCVDQGALSLASAARSSASAPADRRETAGRGSSPIVKRCLLAEP